MTTLDEMTNEQQALTTRVLLGRAFLIRTPACIKLYAHMERWLINGLLGAIIYGRSRLGKTSAARWVLRALQETIAPIPWIEVPARKQHLTNEGAFFQFLLHCARNRYYNKGTVANRRDRLTETLAIRARRSPTKTIILFFDEAQLLTEHHYYWLLNISNELEVLGLRLFCLLVGQHQLVDRQSSFVLEGREEIVGRFMTESWAFPGIEDLHQSEKCLNEYGDTLYPAKDGRPFPAYYVPKAVCAGWKMIELAQPLWEQFSQRWSTATGSNAPIIPMHYFNSAIVNLLNQLRKVDGPELTVTEKMVSKAVKESGFSNAIVALQR